MGTPTPIGDEYGTRHPLRRARRGLGLGGTRVRCEAGGNVSVWDGFGDEPVERHWHLYRSERYGPAPHAKSGFKVVPCGQSPALLSRRPTGGGCDGVVALLL